MTPSTPSRYEQLLAAVVRDPDDDTPRLELAASVRPYEPGFAAFITLQIARVARLRQAHETETELIPGDEQRLLARHRAAWTRGVSLYTNRRAGGELACTFYRGFVEQVEVDPDVFVERSAELLRQAPIRHLDFAPVRPGALARLLMCEALRELDSIGLAGAGLDDDAVAALAACPHLAPCLYLDLGRNPLGPRAFAALAASPHLRRLLVVERKQDTGLDPAQTYHPGEIVVTRSSATGTTASLRPMTDDGRALEAQHGPLPWLHRRNRVSRFDARWYTAHGLRPVVPRSPP